MRASLRVTSDRVRPMPENELTASERAKIRKGDMVLLKTPAGHRKWMRAPSAGWPAPSVPVFGVKRQ